MTKQELFQPPGNKLIARIPWRRNQALEVRGYSVGRECTRVEWLPPPLADRRFLAMLYGWLGHTQSFAQGLSRGP